MGLHGPELEGLKTGALLHDIGKLGVPEYVLLKPGRLTDEEFAKVKKHPEIGAAILDPVDFPWPVLPVVKYHHEKWDGSGYPEGLKGEEIPLTARILAVGDVYDALTSNRSYRHAMTHEEALETIREGVGTHFDPKVAEAFFDVIEDVVAGDGRRGSRSVRGASRRSPARALPRRTWLRGTSSAPPASCARSMRWHRRSPPASAWTRRWTSWPASWRRFCPVRPVSSCFRRRRRVALEVRTAVGVNREFFLGSRTLGAASPSVCVAQNARELPRPPTTRTTCSSAAP